MTRSFRIPAVHRRPWAALPLILATAWACLALPARAADLLVAPDGSGPYANIQDALDAAGTGDNILLMAGTYTGFGNRNLNSEVSVTIRPQIIGYQVTIDMQGSAASPAYGIIVVDGTLTLDHLTFRNAYGPHGAVDVSAGALHVNRCNFFDNASDRGGALRCAGGDRIVMTDCILAENTASIEGGAIYATDFGEIDLTSCTLFMNEANEGSGIFLNHESTLAMDLCIVAYGKGTRGISEYYGGGFTVTNTDIWGNEGGDWVWGLAPLLGTGGNLHVDPEMCDPMGERFALTAGSPCAPYSWLVLGAAGQDLSWDVPIYGLRGDGSGIFPTIQAALDGVPGQAAIRLFGGLYQGPGNVDLDFQGKQIELSSIPGHQAIIDATSWDAQPKRGVWLQDGEPVGTSIHDLVIRNGSATSYGGGVYVTGGSSVALRNVSFQDNQATVYGSAVAALGAGEVVVDACTFDGNGPGDDVYSYGTTMWIGNVDWGAGSVKSVDLNGGGGGVTFSNVTFDGCLGVNATDVYAPVLFENCTLVRAGNNGRTVLSFCDDVRFSGCVLRSDGAADTQFIFADNTILSCEDCSFEGAGTFETNVVAVTAQFSDLSFRRSSFSNLRSDPTRGAVDLLAVSSATLDSCTFDQGAIGVSSGNLSYRTIAINDCQFTAMDTAVKVTELNPGHVIIADTEFTVCGQGVEVTDGTDVQLTRCGFRGTGPGVPVLSTNATLAVVDCEFHDANVTSVPGRRDAGGIGATGGAVTVTGSEFLRNDCELAAGGISMNGGNLVIGDCLFADNRNLQANSSLETGGALRCDAMTSFEMTGSRLERNTADEAGAASITAETLTLTSCEIVDNTAAYANGGLFLQPYFTTGVLSMDSCLVAGNSAPGGAGVEIMASPSVQISHCTIVANGSPTGLGQVRFDGTGNLDLQSSIIAYGAGGGALVSSSGPYVSMTVSCTDVHDNEGGDWIGHLAPFAGVAGNLDVKPWFCDADAGDYRLAGDSPCAATENLCGVTMGAFPADCANVSGVESAPSIQVVALHQNQPNPFNPATSIRFELPREAAVTLRIYDVAGRLVRELLSGEVMPMGAHGVVWNGRDGGGRDQATGLYLYRLQAGEVEIVRKMALMK